MRRSAAAAPLAASLLAASLLACSSEPPPTPEEAVRAAVAEAEEAVRRHDLAVVKDLIATDYADSHGRDRQALVALLTHHFLRNQTIHVLVRIRSVEVADEATARVDAFVATAGQPIPGLGALAEMDADLLHVDADWVRRDGVWQVRSAIWKRASVQDLL